MNAKKTFISNIIFNIIVAVILLAIGIVLGLLYSLFLLIPSIVLIFWLCFKTKMDIKKYNYQKKFDEVYSDIENVDSLYEYLHYLRVHNELRKKMVTYFKIPVYEIKWEKEFVFQICGVIKFYMVIDKNSVIFQRNYRVVAKENYPQKIEFEKNNPERSLFDLVKSYNKLSTKVLSTFN